MRRPRYFLNSILGVVVAASEHDRAPSPVSPRACRDDCGIRLRDSLNLSHPAANLNSSDF
jgi:hypothetical protein